MKFKTLQKSFFLVFASLLFCGGISGQQTFGIEKKMKYSTAPSPPIWKILKKSANDFNCGTPVKKWFQISKVNINNDQIDDLIAYPKEPCIQGNNIATFFIFRGLGGNKYKLVLKTGALSVSIINGKKGSYKKIKTYSFVGQKVMVRTYSFDAKSYRMSSEIYEEPAS